MGIECNAIITGGVIIMHMGEHVVEMVEGVQMVLAGVGLRD